MLVLEDGINRCLFAQGWHINSTAKERSKLAFPFRQKNTSEYLQRRWSNRVISDRVIPGGKERGKKQFW